MFLFCGGSMFHPCYTGHTDTAYHPTASSIYAVASNILVNFVDIRCSSTASRASARLPWSSNRHAIDSHALAIRDKSTLSILIPATIYAVTFTFTFSTFSRLLLRLFFFDIAFNFKMLVNNLFVTTQTEIRTIKEHTNTSK